MVWPHVWQKWEGLWYPPKRNLHRNVDKQQKQWAELCYHPFSMGQNETKAVLGTGSKYLLKLIITTHNALNQCVHVMNSTGFHRSSDNLIKLFPIRTEIHHNFWKKNTLHTKISKHQLGTRWRRRWHVCRIWSCPCALTILSDCLRRDACWMSKQPEQTFYLPQRKHLVRERKCSGVPFG